MSIRLAIVGFRHGHLFELYQHAREMDAIEVVGACEEDRAAREEVASQGLVDIPHKDFDEMLATVDCHAIAVGDYYACAPNTSCAPHVSH